MSQYKILPSQVLIVPGYTNEEIIAMSAKTKNSSASALKNATSSTDKTAKDDNKKSDTNSDTNKTSSSSSQTQTRLIKSKKGTSVPKLVNELKNAYKQASIYSTAKNANYYTKKYGKNIHKRNFESNSKLNTEEAAGKSIASKIANKSTTTNSSKNKKQSATKNTSKTKTTKKTSKASNKTKTTSKESNSSKSNTKSYVNESSAATATESQVKIEKPKALLFSPTSVDYTPHRKDYEEFNSADGLILIEKACDQFAELQLSLSVHQAMRIQENGTIELSNTCIWRGSTWAKNINVLADSEYHII